MPKCLLPALGSQPRLRFVGTRGAGDEVYDLVGLEGLLGVRPGQNEREVFVFFDRSSTATGVFRRLTGVMPTSELVPVRLSGPASAWGSSAAGATGLRVVLEQTLLACQTSKTAASFPQPQPAGGAGHKDGGSAKERTGRNQQGSGGELLESNGTATGDEEPVPESWEDT